MARKKTAKELEKELEAEIKAIKAAEKRRLNMPAKELARLLKESGLSNRALGRALCITDTTVGRWARGVAPIAMLEGLGIVTYFQTVHGLDSRWDPFKLKAAA